MSTSDDVGSVLLTHRRARTLLVALHVPYTLTAPIVTATGLRPDTAGEPWVVTALALCAFALQLDHSLAAAAGRRPRRWPLTFAALVAVVYLPLFEFSINWASAQWFVVASALMLLPRALGLACAMAPVVGMALWVFDYGRDAGATMASAVNAVVFWIAGLGLGGASLWGAVLLVRAGDELFRTELAEGAVDRERQRVSRDLHDLLGQALTAVSLRARWLAPSYGPTPTQRRRRSAASPPWRATPSPRPVR